MVVLGGGREREGVVGGYSDRTLGKGTGLNVLFIAITSFRGKARFLSNFYPAPVTLDGVVYPTVENAYQAAKTDNPEERRKFVNISPAEAKAIAPKRPSDWKSRSLLIMEDLVRQKFKQHPELGQRLVETYPRQLIEGNYWNDTFFGVCRGIGENHLGKILMKVREELLNEGKAVCL